MRTFHLHSVGADRIVLAGLGSRAARDAYAAELKGAEERKR
jgi:hypothetical protein